MIQAAVDHVDWIDAYTADVTVDGRTCRITIPLLKKSSTAVVRGVHINVSLGQRPIEFDLGARGRTHFSMPTAKTGDAAFDDRFIIHAIPIEPVVAAFDADVRRWAATEFPEWPSLTTKDGNLQLWHQTVFELRGSTSPEKLRSSIQWALHVGDRLTAEFDRAHAEVNRSSGQAAADQWLADVHGAHERRGRNRTVIRVLVFGVLAIAIPLVFIWTSLPGR